MRHAHHLQKFINTTAANRARQSKEFAVKIKRFHRCQEPVHVTLFRQVPDAPLHSNIRGILTEHGEISLAAMQQTKNHLDGGALAAAVWTKQPKDFVAADLK